MKKLLETLYVTTPESYLFCRNENICVKIGGEEKASVPAVMLDGIVCFGEMTVSTPLIGFCAEHGITLTFLSSKGRFYSRICGPVSGNVLLRKRQYQALDDVDFQMKFVRNLLVGKLLNEKNVLMRAARTQDAATSKKLREACQSISRYAAQLEACDKTYQLAFMDIVLPEQDGIRITRKWKNSGRFDEVVFVSAHDDKVFASFDTNPLYFVRKTNLDEDLEQAIISYKRKISATQVIVQEGAKYHVWDVNEIEYLASRNIPVR